MWRTFPWPSKTLTQLEGEDWGPPTYDTYVVIDAHRLRYKPLKDFTPEDLRFLLGQQMSLPLLVPMALDVLEVEPFAEGDFFPGDLLAAALKVDARFWQANPQLWTRLDGVVRDRCSREELLEAELLRSVEAFEKHRPADQS